MQHQKYEVENRSITHVQLLPVMYWENSNVVFTCGIIYNVSFITYNVLENCKIIYTGYIRDGIKCYKRGPEGGVERG